MTGSAREENKSRSDTDKGKVDARDAELMVRGLAGDHEAMTQVVEKFYNELFRSIFPLVRDRELTQEFIQETWAHAIANRDRFYVPG